ncbi:MAG: molybdenum cofactor biosynthesis protein A [Maribacter sp.]|jgi:molybdenum cofactor biosynthesis protein A
MKYTQLKDSHDRIINYMRLAVTDRCNLRCFYCMPEEGIKFLERKNILSFDEMSRLIHILHPMGVDKIRITGGEPFARKGLIPFLKEIKKEVNLKSLSITTNATLTQHFMDDIPHLFDTINISLDSLDKGRFFDITRRDMYDTVMENIEALIATGINVKINAVVMSNKNIEDILPFVEWTKNKNIEMRFIEEMPFNGTRDSEELSNWNHKDILKHIQSEFKDIEKLPALPSSTSMMFQVKGFKGKFGIIPAFSRTFCGTCNRIRITAKGDLRTCLYSSKGTDLLSPMRNDFTDEQISEIILKSIMNKEKDGFEAAKQRNGFIPIYESMTTIGG